MTCSTCGRDNPAHLTFCQECGQRLGPRIAPPTPPIGLTGGADEPSPPPPAIPAHQPPLPRPSTSLGMPQADPFGKPPPPPAAATGEKRCRVCETPNAPNLRYCTSCGSSLDAPPLPNAAANANTNASAAPAAPVAQSNYGPPPAPLGGPPDAISPARVVDLGQGGAQPSNVRTCNRCRGVVDPGAQFCKFCGASLGEAGSHPRVPAANGSSPNLSPGPLPVAPVAPVAKPIAPPTPMAAFAPQGVGPMPSPSPIGGHGSAPSAYGPPPPMPISPSAAPPPAPGSPGMQVRAPGPPPVPAPAFPSPAAPAAPPPVPAASPAPPPIVPAPAGGVAAAAAKPASIPTRGRLVVIAKSGADGPSYPFGDTLDIGRTEGHVIVGEDPYLSPRHVRIAYANGKVLLRDLGSTNGVFLRLAPGRDMNGARSAGPTPSEVAVPLQDQDLILVGQQVLRFDVLRESETGLGTASEHGTLLFGSPAAPRYARLSQRTVEGVTRDVYYLRKMETVLGRESGDVVFTEDPFLSRRHAAIRALGRDGTPLPASSKPAPTDVAKFALADLGSSNGTFLRIRNEIELLPGDQFRVGQQLFRVDMPGT